MDSERRREQLEKVSKAGLIELVLVLERTLERTAPPRPEIGPIPGNFHDVNRQAGGGNRDGSG